MFQKFKKGIKNIREKKNTFLLIYPLSYRERGAGWGAKGLNGHVRKEYMFFLDGFPNIKISFI